MNRCDHFPSRFSLPDYLSTAVAQTLADYQMVATGDHILVAVSGGPDSVALCRILYTLRDRFQIKLGIAHFNHQLRAEAAERDQAFVQALAHHLSLPFYSQQADVNAFARSNKLSVETAGRRLRYAFFNEIAQQYHYSKIATGHTRDDAVEQVLLNLLRGAGSKGLAGIPPVRDKMIIRPLIRLAKTEIVTLLADTHHPFMLDESNNDLTYLRNRIRHHLLPLLENEYNPEIKATLSRTGDIMRDENALMEELTEDVLPACRLDHSSQSITLSKSALNELHPALKKRVLRLCIQQLKKNLKKISHTHLSAVIEFCRHRSGGKSLDLPDRIRIYKTKDAIKIKKEDRSLREIGKAEKEKKRLEKQEQKRQN